MQTQSAKTPTPSESVTITLTTREFAFIQGMIYARSFLNHQESDEFKVCEVNNINFVDRLKKKLDYFQPNIGDACATPAHIPEAPGQGGTIICQHCDGNGTDYVNDWSCKHCHGLGHLFDDSRCKDCTRLTPEEVQGNVRQGGTNAIDLLKEYLLLLGDYASVMPSEKWVNRVRSLVSDSLKQGGTITCHLCEGQGTYTKLNSSKLFECEWCRGTGLRSVEGDSSFMQCHSPD